MNEIWGFRIRNNWLALLCQSTVSMLDIGIGLLNLSIQIEQPYTNISIPRSSEITKKQIMVINS